MHKHQVIFRPGRIMSQGQISEYSVTGALKKDKVVTDSKYWLL